MMMQIMPPLLSLMIFCSVSCSFNWQSSVIWEIFAWVEGGDGPALVNP